MLEQVTFCRFRFLLLATFVLILTLVLGPTYSLSARQEPQESRELAPNSESGPEPGPESQSIWYRSNKLGMALTRLSEPPNLIANLEQWILQIDTNPQQRRKTLYLRAQVRDVWELRYQNGLPIQEQHRRLGKLLENRFFDESGLLSEISRYQNGKLEQQSLFFYNETGALDSSLTYDGSGVLLRESSYRIGEDGQLIKLKVLFYTTERSLVQFELPSVRSLSQSGLNTSNSSRHLVSLFNRQRQNVSQIVYEGQRVARRTDFRYSAAGNLASARIAEAEKITLYSYNAGEQPLQKRILKDAKEIERENYIYDRFGRLSRKTAQNPVQNLEERYSYSGQRSDAAQITFYRNSEIDKIRTYQDLYNYTEELYLDGAAVAKIYYSHGDELESEIIPNPEDFGSP